MPKKRQMKPREVADTAIAKARGIVFVMSQAAEGQVMSPDAQFADSKLTGYALWALGDLLAEAEQAIEAIGAE